MKLDEALNGGFPSGTMMMISAGKGRQSLTTYTVGGFVRDTLLGKSPKDVDYVVVGSSPEEMLELGFSQVGLDFPVFLHPETGEEYALARTERKVGPGYSGFAVETRNVTLKEDLARRDLTINAMAFDEIGNLIDYFGGKADLYNRILRHVSHHFSEDPVRILRVARFAARYDFSVAPETIQLMKDMVNSGEFSNLTPERVWLEFQKAFEEEKVSRFIEVLMEVGALEKLPGMPSKIDVSILTPDKSYHYKVLYTLSHINKSVRKSHWRIPANILWELDLFEQYRTKPNFYSGMSSEDRIRFIKKSKIQHNYYSAYFVMIAVLFDQPGFQLRNLESEVEAIQDDAVKLSRIDYEALVKSYKGPDIASYILNHEVKML